jgi:(2Fe-2S) ferredoxin
MERPEIHILVCSSFRMSGRPQGVCHKKGAAGLLPVLQEGILDRGLDAVLSTTGCLKVCDRGPVMVIYPHNWWYGQVDEEKIEEILDALEDGKPVEEYLIA